MHKDIKISGFTFFEVSISFIITSILIIMSMYWIKPAFERIALENLLQTLEQGIIFSRTEALNQHQTLRLVPLESKFDFSEGMRLRSSEKIFKEWHWQSLFLPDCQITWHGFQRSPGILFSTDIQNLTSNGYFLLSVPNKKSIKLVINRMGNTRRDL